MAYVEIAELKRVLQKPTPTVAEEARMQADIDAVARKIDWDLSYSVENPAPSVDTPEYAILASVNLNAAVEEWKSHFTPFGASVLSPEAGAVISPRDPWYRHHLALQALRTEFSIG